MPLAASNAALLACSLLAAVGALFWPQLEQAWQQQQQRDAGGGGSAAGRAKCPLGYEGAMPANHPPVAGAQQQQQQRQAQQRQLRTYNNARIWTANPEVPWASAFTVDLRSGEVVHVQPAAGSGAAADAAADTGAAPSGGSVVDLQGSFVMPAFVDPHVHLIPGGLTLMQVNLRGVRSRQDLAARLQAAAAAEAAKQQQQPQQQQQRWLQGFGWSEPDWGGELPNRSWIDEACGGLPAFLTRMDSHMAFANTAALQAAGLLAPPQQQQDGQPSTGEDVAAAVAAADAAGLIDRDPSTGLPTGLLREGAMQLVERLIPHPSLEERAAALHAAGRHLLSHGITAVGDMGWALFGPPESTWEDLEQLYDPAAEAGSLPVRVSAYVPLRSWRRLAARVAASGSYHAASGRLAWGGVKEFADGSLGSSTALFWSPYLDAAGSDGSSDGGSDGSSSSSSSSSSSDGHASGTRTIDTNELRSLAAGAAGAGLQVAVHAIGDRAVDEVAQALAAAQQQQPQQQPPLQHRIEHVQHLSSPAAAAAMAAAGLAGTPNPQHLLSDRAMLLPKLGAERAGPGRAFAYRTLADSGVMLGYASDFPVVDVSPFESIYAAVHRTDPPQPGGAVAATSQPGGSEQPPWAGEQERLPLEAVLLGHTAHAARIARLDHWVGALAPGLRADFVRLSRSPFAGSGSEDGLAAGLPRVVQTYMDGACVHGCERSDAPPGHGGDGEPGPATS